MYLHMYMSHRLTLFFIKYKSLQKLEVVLCLLIARQTVF